MKLKVLEVIGEDTYFANLKNQSIGVYSGSLLINGKATDELDVITISKNDKIQYLNKYKELSHYEKDGKIMSVSEYDSLNTYVDSDNSECDILKALENRKKKEGFKSVYKEPIPKDVEVYVVGNIQNTGSEFIKCTTTIGRNTNSNIYTVQPNNIAVDEFDVLKEKYSSHAKFDRKDRSYLRFAQVDNNYIFGDYYPYCEHNHTLCFKSLGEAQAEELSIRSKVASAVERAVFKDDLSDVKKTNVINYLTNIKRAKSLNDAFNMIDILIEDLVEYRDNIKFNK